MAKEFEVKIRATSSLRHSFIYRREVQGSIRLSYNLDYICFSSVHGSADEADGTNCLGLKESK